MPCPSIEHECAPQKSPRHRPRPAPDTAHPPAGHALPEVLQCHADTHENEERPSAAKLRSPPESPNANVVQHGGHAKRGEHCARPPEQRTARARAKHGEDAPEALVPAEAPEVGERGGLPGARGKCGPVCRGLSQEHAPDERRSMVHHLDGRVRGETAAERKERRKRGAGKGVEVWIEERVARNGAKRRADVPHNMDGHVIHSQLEKQLEDHGGE